MKTLVKTANIILYLVVVITLTASIGSFVSKRPYMLSVVRSYSMYPLLTRGDMVLVDRLRPNEQVREGDIVLFRAEKGTLASQGWIIHRIIGGNETDGYITKGDNNGQTDQANGGAAPIRREWIAGSAYTIGRIPVKIPLLGYVPLWAERFQKNTYSLPIIGLVLGIVIAIGELQPKRQRRRRSSRLEMPLIYFFGGLTLSVVLGASMLATSQGLSLVYEVSDQGKGVIMGSDVGILQVGEEAERPLADLNNRTFLPIVATCTSRDPQISFSHDTLYLTKGQVTKTTFRVKATSPGQYQSRMWVGMFFPFLPASVIYALAKRSFWLALLVVALLPGFPIMLYPLMDRRMRRQTAKEVRQSWSRLRAKLPF